MPSYKAPLEDVSFLLNDVFQIDRYNNLPGFSDASADVREAILAEAAKLSEEVLQPLNRVGDLEGCTRHDDGRVTTPKGFKEAFRQVAEGGWLGLSCAGGIWRAGPAGHAVANRRRIPDVGQHGVFDVWRASRMGATAALMVHGKPEQKKMFVPKMVAGQWTGTMNLTEPQCGTDLGLLRTKAVKQADGSYKITGTKIFISAGEHDLAENIIHLVLARIEGAPAGIKGVSLFVVPKVLVNADGSLGAPNGVTCGSIEHKMGIHGNSTCVMNYDGATGWLIGEENKGMQGMFVMMNEARLGVAVQGLAQSEVAYQNAAAYAKDRLQGRSLSGPKAPDKPADPIIVHPGRAPHAAHHPRLQRGRARDGGVDLAEERRRASLRQREGPPGSRRSYGPDDADPERRAHRRRILQRGAGAADVRRPRLYRRMGHGAVRARCAHRHDL